MTKHTSKSQKPNRDQQHAAMLKEALARPGVREVMQVYQNYQETDKGLDSYRQAIKCPEIVTTTDHANVQ